MALDSRPCFYLTTKVFEGDLVVGLAIDDVILTKGEIAVSFSIYSLWKVVTSFQK